MPRNQGLIAEEQEIDFRIFDNYQAHLFNSTYDGVDRRQDGAYWGSTGDFIDDRLRMKWSDDWLSNKDCNGNGKLDRGATMAMR